MQEWKGRRQGEEREGEWVVETDEGNGKQNKWGREKGNGKGKFLGEECAWADEAEERERRQAY